MLTEMLDQSESFKSKPIPEQKILTTLASKFQQSTEFLFLDPQELFTNIGIGTPDQWKELLQLQETQNFIKGQIAFFAQVSQRKTFRSLVQMALDGGQGAQQAAKQVQELSGILNQQDKNRTVVLHKIPRPEVKS